MKYTFDNIFGKQNNNEDIYIKTCKPLIEKCLEDGYNGTIFAYG